MRDGRDECLSSEPASVPSRPAVAERAVVVADLILRAKFVSKDVPKAPDFLLVSALFSGWPLEVAPIVRARPRA
jgi:hypothetical protein